jgi:hypothetical protein
MRRFLANVLFLFVGLPLTLSALFLISARPWALDRDTYKRFVEDDRLYAALQAPEMASRAPATIELRPAGLPPLTLDGPALTTAAQKDLPWPEIKRTASRSVDAVLDAVEGRAPGGAAAIDLRQLKAALKARSPAAARDYLAALAAAGRPAPAAQGPILAAALGLAVDAVPDTAKLDPASLPAPRPGLLPMMRPGLRGMPLGILSRGPEALSQAVLNRMTATTAALSALLIAGLGALGGTGLVSRLSRAGRYLLLPSIVVLGVGVLLAIPGGLILQNVLPAEARAMVAGQAGAQLRAYLASALGPIARSFFITGLVGASVGGVLASSRKFTEPKELE